MQLAWSCSISAVPEAMRILISPSNIKRDMVVLPYLRITGNIPLDCKMTVVHTKCSAGSHLENLCPEPGLGTSPAAAAPAKIAEGVRPFIRVCTCEPADAISQVFHNSESWASGKGASQSARGSTETSPCSPMRGSQLLSHCEVACRRDISQCRLLLASEGKVRIFHDKDLVSFLLVVKIELPSGDALQSHFPRAYWLKSDLPIQVTGCHTEVAGSCRSAP